MAGNFWQSSHFQQWLLERQEVLCERTADLKILTEDEYQKITIFFTNVIQALGEQLKVRQQVIATAIVYFRRFYARNSLKSIDPLLLAPTCLVLASKVEEFGVISQSKLIAACQSLIKNRFNYAYQQEYPYRINHLLEAEFFLLELMDCCLIVYHPYRPLLQFFQDLPPDDGLLQTAWKVINDSYRTDICLFHPPYHVALAALHLASIINNKKLETWFADVSVDMEKVYEVARQILGLYNFWKTFDEKKEMLSILQKMPKPKTQPSRPPSVAGNGNHDSQQGVA